jgi:hypothetical protein
MFLPNRLAFVTFKNNLMVLSLRAMMMQFVFLMCIAIFCFGGFLYALWTWVHFQFILLTMGDLRLAWCCLGLVVTRLGKCLEGGQIGFTPNE